ncbi:uncharacterized protein PHACADRAFT_259100 [Phanerochaete carnosa HHB-10118-sp]|uniref:non-specific serine/threonine protein kinase n=1 Tax=Phanerochaete carnosa (strain HHB-10118-sp) TaxID=650164 RepID=K5VNB2_PHACS|nr:uncharacterized protein PHACADRAFT_259100 [Phanerochaete carnosa HHB-10118-sp]EKM52933.1 hypothetical protein PHACADRAFT_259100 [Phanerochaete carnosa HHB-10118-sp]
MDDLPENRQQEEITVLKSIYGEDFINCPPPKAWKGAPRLPEFIIRVRHPDPEHASKIFFNLHVKFPKTYPTLAPPILTVQQQYAGLKPHEIAKISAVILSETQKLKDTETVFSAVAAAQDWLQNNVMPPVEPVGSLATEMNRRALEAEQAHLQRKEAQAEEALRREAQRQLELEEQIRADAERQQAERARLNRTRERSESDATETAVSTPVEDGTKIVSFPEEIVWEDVHFSHVKLYQAQKECLGIVWQAEPICDSEHSLQLELLVVEFNGRYYSTTHGRKKLKTLADDLRRLSSVRHTNLLAVLACKLTLPNTNTPPKLTILHERRPSLTLHDVLEDCESLREDRASDYLTQILLALNALHTADVLHRGLSTKCVGLVPGKHPGDPKVVKIFKVGFHVALFDMNRSERFLQWCPGKPEHQNMPEGWLPKDALESPLEYTKNRDVHSIGIILLQMLLGLNVVERYPDFHIALRSSGISQSMQQHVLAMLAPTKKHVSPHSLLASMAGVALSNAMRTPSIAINGNGHGPKTPHAITNYSGSPESDYFNKTIAVRPRHASRWKEDWEELELLGRGAFGSVVKARNKMDSRIYAVKKIRLRTNQNDQKIFREVDTLSRLNHRYIVRYYTTWIETSDDVSTATSAVGSSAGTSVPGAAHGNGSTTEEESDPFAINLDDLDDFNDTPSHSFPAITFTRSGTPRSDEGESGSSDEDGTSSDEVASPVNGRGRELTKRTGTPVPSISRTLYIQMEYVERQTLKERIAEGLSESETWRLFQQIVDALVHMSSMNILHRDIKLTNIFIDGKGDCKIGDFGLATSALAVVDPTDLIQTPIVDADMTLDVGTRLYIAPEVQSSKGKARNHAKADMYSLGVVFFEMNHPFTTGFERIRVLEHLRTPEIMFPSSWDSHRTRQKQIISWLLKHDPDERPTALELSQSNLLPPRVEDEFFKDTLKLIVKHDSPYRQSVLSTLFSQTTKPSHGFLYDQDEVPEHTTLNGMVHDRMVQIFRLHGAVDMEPPLLLPVLNPDDDYSRAVFLDRNGDVVSLPNNPLVPFARMAARTNIRRIKRFHISDIYRPDPVAGHPKASKAAVFDIITQDLECGPSAAIAEAIAIVNDCLDSFANLEKYEIHLSHSKIYDTLFDQVPPELRNDVLKLLVQSNASPSQRRQLLIEKGLTRSFVDCIEVLADGDADVDELLSRLERVSPQMVIGIYQAAQEIKSTMHCATATGVTRTIYFHPLFMMRSPTNFFDGLCFEVVKRQQPQQKRSDTLAIGGRYDKFVNRFSPVRSRTEGLSAVGVQISLEKITVALASYQSASQKSLKERKSYGYWSPRRCDVYVVSHQSGHLADRLEVTSLLWRNSISADMMYEFGLQTVEHENVVEQCSREGILFIVYPRPRNARRDQPAFKVKSVLKGVEYELSKQELVPFLHQQIAEQKRIDASLSGAPLISVAEGTQAVAASKEATGPEVQLLLQGDAKKQRKQTKQMYMDRAFEFGVDLKNAMAQSNVPIVAVDVSDSLFDQMTKSTMWLSDENAWKALVAQFPTSQSSYAHQIREAVLRRKADGCKFLILFAVKEERPFLINL